MHQSTCPLSAASDNGMIAFYDYLYRFATP